VNFHPAGDLTIRSSEPSDQESLNTFFSSQEIYHRHFDWLSAADWLGCEPFYILERDGKIIAAIACPEDPDNIAWIRFYYVSPSYRTSEIFKLMIDHIVEFYHKRSRNVTLVSLSTTHWFTSFLESANFKCRQHVVVLEWLDNYKCQTEINPDLSLLTVDEDDLPLVENIDRQSFPPLWQVPGESLRGALKLDLYGKLLYHEDDLVGYQLSNCTTTSIHLSRLAILPKFQQRSFGIVLVKDLIAEARRRNIRFISVNTQEDNLASLALYKKAGFLRTDERYPVFTRDI
jgi:ribosomal protein S18 acetylase RimI-like enzyme